MIKPIYTSPSLRETSLLTLSQFLKISRDFNGEIPPKTGGITTMDEGSTSGWGISGEEMD